jgi:hypothetical protein
VARLSRRDIPKIQLIHKALGQNGMNSDETETEAHGIVPKTVRQIPKIWISEEISQMWEMVETVGWMTLQLMGNSHLQCIFMASGSTLGSSKFCSVIVDYLVTFIVAFGGRVSLNHSNPGSSVTWFLGQYLRRCVLPP